MFVRIFDIRNKCRKLDLLGQKDGRKWRAKEEMEGERQNRARESPSLSTSNSSSYLPLFSPLREGGCISLSSLPAYNKLCYPMLEMQAHLKNIQTKYYISQRLTRSGAPFPCWCDVVGSVSESSSTTWFSLGGRGFNCDLPVGIVKLSQSVSF